MKTVLLSLICLLSMQALAQEEKLRVAFNVGNPLELNVADIKDITFVEDSIPLDIVGEWFLEEVEEHGVFESFEFREDGTLTFCPYYTNYHSGYTLPGTYSFEDYTLTMEISILGVLTYSVTRHTGTSYTVRSAGTESVYYKVQKVYNMTVNDSPIFIGNEGDSVVFVDNEFIGLENGKIKALQKGSGYALVLDSERNSIVAYKIIVQYSPCEVTDWTKYFGKTKDDIIAEFGTPDTNSTEDYIVYQFPSAYKYLSYLTFSIDEETGKVFQTSSTFKDFEDLKTYYSEIKGHYVFQEDMSSSTELYYYDTEGNVRIYISSSPIMQIIYTDWR